MRRRALVTGAAHRVGRAIALELASAGIDVAVHYRSSSDAAEDVAQACRALGVQAFTVAGDLSDLDQTRAVVETVRDQWSHLSILVNNASYFAAAPFEDVSIADLQKLHALHVQAPLVLSQGLLEPLRQAAELDPDVESSLIVHMVDIAIERPFKGYTAYSASKAGLAMLLKSMAVELAPAVRTVGLAPGHVAWPPDYDDKTKDRMLRRIPMGRVGQPSDVAKAVRFLFFDGAYINGDVIKLDGGLSQRY